MTARADDKDLTFWLRRMSEGDELARERVASAVYSELHRVAARVLAGEGRDHSLQPTLLVNEAFLRLFGSQSVDWQNRQHFFLIAARMMRRIVIDYFRQRGAQKRPPVAMQLSLEDAVVFREDRLEEALMVDEALKKLEVYDATAAQVVELRYFAGFSTDEVARLLRRSDRSIKRDWSFAQAWLRRYFDGEGKHSGASLTE